MLTPVLRSLPRRSYSATRLLALPATAQGHLAATAPLTHSLAARSFHCSVPRHGITDAIMGTVRDKMDDHKGE
jgi:hypothetical protein